MGELFGQFCELFLDFVSYVVAASKILQFLLAGIALGRKWERIKVDCSALMFLDELFDFGLAIFVLVRSHRHLFEKLAFSPLFFLWLDRDWLNRLLLL